MVMIRIVVTAVVVAAAGIMVFFWFFQSDEAKIKKQFNVIAELASKASDEHELTAAVNARKIGEKFAETCRIEIPAYNISRTYAGKEISARIMGARSRYAEILLTFHDIDIRFPEEETARVVFTAYVEAVRLSGEPFREVHELVCRLEKNGNDWLLTQIEGVLVLER